MAASNQEIEHHASEYQANCNNVTSTEKYWCGFPIQHIIVSWRHDIAFILVRRWHTEIRAAYSASVFITNFAIIP